MNRPQTHEYPEWGRAYIDLVEGDVIEVLEKQIVDFSNLLNNNIDKGDYAYAPGKWTLKELVGHIIDTERIFTYRLVCFARGEKAPLPGFEEDDYVANAHFNDRSLMSLAEEFSITRKSILYLVKSLNEKELDNIGTSNGREMSARAVVYAIAGHLMHHTRIIKERYL
ncbi:MAG: DinB family protein [Bacteroidota bacterium]